ncbi:MAG: hypothetical protein QM602_00580 [Microbacterium sp.]
MTQNPPGEPAVAVTVIRTGGFAGLHREWRAEPPPSQAARWVALIESCPWDDLPREQPRGADLFVWRIRARCEVDDGELERDAELQDPQVQGPWQILIDEVRATSAAASSA